MATTEVGSSSSQEGLAVSAVVMCGWITKEGQVVKNWKTRWALLTRGQLSYFASKKSLGTPKGTIATSSFVRIDAAPYKNKEYPIAIHTSSSRVLHFSALDRLSHHCWMRAISALLSESFAALSLSLSEGIRPLLLDNQSPPLSPNSHSPANSLSNHSLSNSPSLSPSPSPTPSSVPSSHSTPTPLASSPTVPPSSPSSSSSFPHVPPLPRPKSTSSLASISLPESLRGSPKQAPSVTLTSSLAPVASPRAAAFPEGILTGDYSGPLSELEFHVQKNTILQHWSQYKLVVSRECLEQLVLLHLHRTNAPSFNAALPEHLLWSYGSAAQFAAVLSLLFSDHGPLLRVLSAFRSSVLSLSPFSSTSPLLSVRARVADARRQASSCRPLSALYRTLFAELLSSAAAELSLSPSDYCAIALGAAARDEMCPHSQLQWALLLSDNISSSSSQSFSSSSASVVALRLAVYLELLLTCLGESPPAELPAFLGLAPGLSVDSLGGSPTGIPGSFSFIGTPSQLALLHSEASFPGAPLRSRLLRRAVVLSGNEELLKQYQEASCRHIDGCREERAVQQLSRHLQALQCDRDPEAGDLVPLPFQLQQELHQPLEELLDSLSLYYSLDHLPYSGLLPKLVAMGVLSEEAAGQLQEAQEEAMRLRYEVQEFCGDHLEALPLSKHDRFLDESRQRRVCRVFRVVVPLQATLHALVAARDPVVLRTRRFEEPVEALMPGLLRFGMRFLIRMRFLESLLRDPEDALACSALGAIEWKLHGRGHFVNKVRWLYAKNNPKRLRFRWQESPYIKALLEEMELIESVTIMRGPSHARLSLALPADPEIDILEDLALPPAPPIVSKERIATLPGTECHPGEGQRLYRALQSVLQLLQSRHGLDPSRVGPQTLLREDLLLDENAVQRLLSSLIFQYCFIPMAPCSPHTVSDIATEIVPESMAITVKPMLENLQELLLFLVDSKKELRKKLHSVWTDIACADDPSALLGGLSLEQIELLFRPLVKVMALTSFSPPYGFSIAKTFHQQALVLKAICFLRDQGPRYGFSKAQVRYCLSMLFWSAPDSEQKKATAGLIAHHIIDTSYYPLKLIELTRPPDAGKIDLGAVTYHHTSTKNNGMYVVYRAPDRDHAVSYLGTITVKRELEYHEIETLNGEGTFAKDIDGDIYLLPHTIGQKYEAPKQK